jgi:hypothetical protein
MSLKNSINKLRQAMAASVDNKAISQNSRSRRYLNHGRMADGSWDPTCCLYFEVDNPSGSFVEYNPKVYLYCSNRLIGEVPLNQVASNAKMCKGNVRPSAEQAPQAPQPKQSMPGYYNLPPDTPQ